MPIKKKSKRKLKPIVKKTDKHIEKSVNRFENKLDRLLKQGDLKSIYIANLEHIKNKHWTEAEIKLVADSMLKWFKADKNYWFKNFAIEMDIPYKLLKEKFYKESEYFAYIFDLCKDIQESKLFTLGINTRSSMPIFALKNVSNWRDKTDIEHTVKDVNAIKKEIEEIFEQ